MAAMIQYFVLQFSIERRRDQYVKILIGCRSLRITRLFSNKNSGWVNIFQKSDESFLSSNEKNIDLLVLDLCKNYYYSIFLTII